MESIASKNMIEEQFKGINEIGDDFGLDDNRKEDLQEIMRDRLFRGYSTNEALQRSIERKIKRKNKELK